MKIARIEIGKVSIPLKKPFKTALRVVHSAEDVVIRLIADTGEIGFGNAPPTALITGDTQDSVIAAIRDILGPKLIGQDVENRAGLLQAIHGGMLRNSSAKAALDIAVHDLFAQRFNMPLYRFFGGLSPAIETDLTISLNAPDEMVRDAQDAVASGFTALKLKVGNAADDMARVKAVRDAVGRQVELRLDANQGWRPKEAVRLIHQLENADLDIAFIEQPVKAQDMAGLKYVSDHVETDIMADESAFSPHDVFALLANRACDLINIKLMKAGGLSSAQKIIHIAESQGIACMIGCMLESKVGITAAASLAAGQGIARADLDAALLLADDPVCGGATCDGKCIQLTEAPGLGIQEVHGWQLIASL